MSTLLTIRHLLEYALLRLIIAAVRAFPLDMARELSAKGWRLLAPYGRRHQRALDNLAIAFPDKTLRSARRSPWKCGAIWDV